MVVSINSSFQEPFNEIEVRISAAGVFSDRSALHIGNAGADRRAAFAQHALRDAGERRKLPAPFKGVVTDLRVDSDSGELQYLVDPDDNPHTPNERWFTTSQIEAQPKPDEETAA